MSRCQGMVQHGYMEDPDNKIYLFMDSYENLQNKEVLADVLRSLALQRMCSGSGEKPRSESDDPILPYILGFSERPYDEVMLSFFFKNAEKRSDATVFLDTCFFLKWTDQAKEFSQTHQINHELIPTTGSADNLLPDAERKCSETFLNWMKTKRSESAAKTELAKTEAELSGFLLRFFEGQTLSVLCEMATRGYVWDAFVLMSLVYPNHEMVSVMRSYVWEKYNLGWIDEVTSAQVEGTYESLTKLGLNSKFCYLMLRKILESRSITTFVRRTTYSSIHVCLLAAAIEAKDDNSAKQLVEDYFRLVSAHPDFLNECLPALQKRYFKQAFVVMSDVICVVLSMCETPMNNKDATLIDDSDASSCVLSKLVDSWVERGVLPSDSSPTDLHEEVHKGVSDVLDSFMGDVLDLNTFSIAGFDYKTYVILSLRIAGVLFRPRSASSYSHVIYEIMVQCGCTEAFLYAILGGQNIDKPSVKCNKSLIAAIGECFLLIMSMYEKKKCFVEALARSNSKETQACSKNMILSVDENENSRVMQDSGVGLSLETSEDTKVNEIESLSASKVSVNEQTDNVSRSDNLLINSNPAVQCESLNKVPLLECGSSHDQIPTSFAENKKDALPFNEETENTKTSEPTNKDASRNELDMMLTEAVKANNHTDNSNIFVKVDTIISQSFNECVSSCVSPAYTCSPMINADVAHQIMHGSTLLSVDDRNVTPAANTQLLPNELGSMLEGTDVVNNTVNTSITDPLENHPIDFVFPPSDEEKVVLQSSSRSAFSESVSQTELGSSNLVENHVTTKLRETTSLTVHETNTCGSDNGDKKTEFKGFGFGPSSIIPKKYNRGRGNFGDGYRGGHGDGRPRGNSYVTRGGNSYGPRGGNSYVPRGGDSYGPRGGSGGYGHRGNGDYVQREGGNYSHRGEGTNRGYNNNR